MTETTLQALREDAWLRMHDTQAQWDADIAAWRRVWFAHLIAMASWWYVWFVQWGI